MKTSAFCYCLLTLLLAACSTEEPGQSVEQSNEPAYHIVDESLERIRNDFNAMQDKLRLVFISGPSCGICLRGMDDLNESIVASLQADPRVHTMLVYVPALGAKERHVAAAVPLMQGPRVSHYWDEQGRSGLEFQQALGIKIYAWDVWMMFAPGARWEPGSPPPEPVFWQHQLPILPESQRLDAEVFADRVKTSLAEIPVTDSAGEAVFTLSEALNILPVAQPTKVILRYHHLSRGGYRKLKTLSAINYKGETEIYGQTFPLTVETARPNQYARIIDDGLNRSVLAWDGQLAVDDGSLGRLPNDIRVELLASYDFDGWMTDWKSKGHQTKRLGMRKLADRLPWIVESKLNNSRIWHSYIDSHTGDVFRHALISADGQEIIALEYADYRDVDGFRLPHEVSYHHGEQLVAIDRFHQITVTTEDHDE